MDDYKFNEVKDVKWQSIGSEDGNIKFKKNKRGYRFRNFLKLIIIIVIAAISGAATSAYIINKKYSGKNEYFYKNQLSNNKSTAETPKNAVNKVAEAVGPAVVGINNKGETFWGSTTQSSGSGIIFDPNGYIVTNNHVIEGASKVTVKLSNGKVLEAKLIGADKRSDLAVIKIEANNLPTAKFGDSSQVKVGDLAIAIGNPLGEEFAGTVTSGIVSALNRTMQYEGAVYKVLQTDAAINPGNSGGALCNENGEVIGINSLKLGANVNAEGMGFAIAINEAKGIVNSLMNYGKVKRPALGVLGKSVSSKDGKIQGFYVNEVVQGSGAAAAGVKPTDVIIELDKTKVKSYEDLSEVLDKHKIGDSVKCTIWRNGSNIDVNIILSEMKDSKS
ncbi:S1C family serine protease [Clostridium rectalis]|uniref:S1C family serine protease n=1 Tax=Clostridium rectalis TaxID=2040295 RepID=UPI000F62C386|nr:trypsin-like peptidase domain-containing protein [Clostridium rectalis]